MAEKGIGLEKRDGHIGEINIEKIDQSLFQAIVSLLDTQRYGVLITQEESYPHGSLVAFAHTRDLKHILFTTATATRKYNNISQFPNSTILIDNRNNLEHDLYKSMCIIIKGSTHKLDKQNHLPLSELYLQKHPQLQSFYDSPGTALMDLAVHKIEIVTRFQNVMIVTINDG